MALQPQMMQRLRYHLLDVFTSSPFGGNQLAVFTDTTSIDPALMPRIARELNLSETVFVLPPRGTAVARLRIFTPGAELPFAGHPTVGTACLLAMMATGTAWSDPGGADAAVPYPFDFPLAPDGTASMVLEEGVGDVHVRVRCGDGSVPPWAQLAAAQPLEARATELAPSRLAMLLGLAEIDVSPGDAATPPALAASCGVPFLFIPVRTGDALARCRLDAAVWDSWVAGTWAPHVFVYTTDRGTAGEIANADIQGRMFAPAMGIVEDPATGAAATALAGVLARHAGRDGTHRWTLAQGVAMGRPSMLELEADVRAGVPIACRVAGYAVVVGRGELRVG